MSSPNHHRTTLMTDAFHRDILEHLCYMLHFHHIRQLWMTGSLLLRKRLADARIDISTPFDGELFPSHLTQRHPRAKSLELFNPIKSHAHDFKRNRCMFSNLSAESTAFFGRLTSLALNFQGALDRLLVLGNLDQCAPVLQSLRVNVVFVCELLHDTNLVDDDVHPTLSHRLTALAEILPSALKSLSLVGKGYPSGESNILFFTRLPQSLESLELDNIRLMAPLPVPKTDQERANKAMYFNRQLPNLTRLDVYRATIPSDLFRSCFFRRRMPALKTMRCMFEDDMSSSSLEDVAQGKGVLDLNIIIPASVTHLDVMYHGDLSISLNNLPDKIRVLSITSIAHTLGDMLRHMRSADFKLTKSYPHLERLNLPRHMCHWFGVNSNGLPREGPSRDDWGPLLPLPSLKSLTFNASADVYNHDQGHIDIGYTVSRTPCGKPLPLFTASRLYHDNVVRCIQQHNALANLVHLSLHLDDPTILVGKTSTLANLKHFALFMNTRTRWSYLELVKNDKNLLRNWFHRHGEVLESLRLDNLYLRDLPVADCATWMSRLSPMVKLRTLALSCLRTVDQINELLVHIPRQLTSLKVKGLYRDGALINVGLLPRDLTVLSMQSFIESYLCDEKAWVSLASRLPRQLAHFTFSGMFYTPAIYRALPTSLYFVNFDYLQGMVPAPMELSLARRFINTCHGLWCTLSFVIAEWRRG